MDLITWIKQTLSNDEDSTDEEIRELFIAAGMTWQQANEWLARRTEALSSPFGLV
jgi:hypothetical protein